MKLWIRSRLDSTVNVADIHGTRITIGSSPRNDIVLENEAVPDCAVVLEQIDAVWHVLALAKCGCRVNDASLYAGQRVVVASKSRLEVYPFRLDVECESLLPTRLDPGRKELDQGMSTLINQIHIDLLARMDVSTDDAERRTNRVFLLALEQQIEHFAITHELKSEGKSSLVDHIVGVSVKQAICNSLGGASKKQQLLLHQLAHTWHSLISSVPELEIERNQLIRRMIAALGISFGKEVGKQLDKLEVHFWDAWEPAARKLPTDFKHYLALREIKKQIKDSVFGYGPLEDLLRNPTISEIMVVNHDRIYIERNGVIENSGRRFVNDKVTELIIERIVQRVNRRIDRSQPMVDARLNDGSRVNAVLPPLAVSGPCLTIRKFPSERLTLEQLIEKGTLTSAVADFLRAAVHERCNVVISGGTGSGKTTLLNCLSEFIPDKERIVTVEDTAELQLSKQHVVRLETRQANVENKGEYTIRDLVKNALRMRPDRIVIGECRGPESLDMLQAMNTGHDGSLTTLHANTPQDAALRLETLVSIGSDLPVQSIRMQIASAIQLVVQIARQRDGRRRITHVTEVVGINNDMGAVRMKDLFRLDSANPEGELIPTGYLPTFMPRLITSGQLALDTFYGVA